MMRILFWKAAKAGNVVKFNEHMDNLKKVSKKAWEELNKIPVEQ